MGKLRLPHERPTAVELSPQQAKQELLGLVNRGDKRVKRLLELMFLAYGEARL
jgi:hypothetical protein